MKLAALALVIAALGLPLNDLPRFALLVVAAVLVFTGRISTSGRRWIAALALVAVCLVAQMTLPFPRIEEGHNVFLVHRAGGALEAGLPPQAYRPMLAEFDARYPPAQRCDPATDGCWRGQGFPDRAFAFSADGMFGRPAVSRRVSGIDFADPVWLRIGFINENRYNWNSLVSDVQRASRDRHASALLHHWRLEMPWFVMYRFPAEFAGSALCWRGEVLWEGPDGQFATIQHADMACRTLTAADTGRSIFGVAIRNNPPLAMRLDPTAKVRAWQMLETALPLVGAAAVLLLLAKWRPRRTLLPLTFIAITLVVVFFNDPSFIGGVRPFDSGDDGLVYDGYARSMLQYLLAGDIYGALRGQESVFYFTPGMRYLRAFEHVIFGESYLGYLALMMFLPMLVFWMFRRFLPVRWALALALTFAAIPIGVVFGSKSRALREMGGARLWRSGRLRVLPLSFPAAYRLRRDRPARSLHAGLRFGVAVRAGAVRAAEPRTSAGILLARRRACGAMADAISPRRRHVPRLPAGVRDGAAQLGLWRRVRAVHHQHRGRAVDAAVCLCGGLLGTAAA